MESEIQEKFNCAFAEIGSQIGDILRCLISQEIDMHMNRITQLSSIIDGNVCDSSEQ
jgi:hypothetical protein